MVAPNERPLASAAGLGSLEESLTFDRFVAEFGKPQSLVATDFDMEDNLILGEADRVQDNRLQPTSLPSSSTSSFSSSTMGANHSMIFRDASQVATEVTPLFSNSGKLMVQKEPGRWKDGLFECFRFGLFHPTVWNAFCCPTLLMGQVLTRLDLNWLGQTDQTESEDMNNNTLFLPARSRSFSETAPYNHTTLFRLASTRGISRHGHHNPNQQHGFSSLSSSHPNTAVAAAATASSRNPRTTAFTRIFILTCLFWTLIILFAPPLPMVVQDPDTGKILALYTPPERAITDVQWFLWKSLLMVFSVYTLLILVRLRQQVRRRFDIEADTDSEDVLVSLCCPYCSVAQLARQTGGDHCEEEAQCCTSTGLQTPPRIKTSSNNRNPTIHRSWPAVTADTMARTRSSSSRSMRNSQNLNHSF